MMKKAMKQMQIVREKKKVKTILLVYLEVSIELTLGNFLLCIKINKTNILLLVAS